MMQTLNQRSNGSKTLSDNLQNKKVSGNNKQELDTKYSNPATHGIEAMTTLIEQSVIPLSDTELEMLEKFTIFCNKPQKMRKVYRFAKRIVMTIIITPLFNNH